MKIISYPEYQNLKKIYKYENFLKSEMSIIKNEVEKSQYEFLFQEDHSFKIKKKQHTDSSSYYFTMYMLVEKVEDEWFLVKMSKMSNDLLRTIDDFDMYFKLDGFENTIEWIKKILIC